MRYLVVADDGTVESIMFSDYFCVQNMINNGKNLVLAPLDGSVVEQCDPQLVNAAQAQLKEFLTFEAPDPMERRGNEGQLRKLRRFKQRKVALGKALGASAKSWNKAPKK